MFIIRSDLQSLKSACLTFSHRHNLYYRGSLGNNYHFSKTNLFELGDSYSSCGSVSKVGRGNLLPPATRDLNPVDGECRIGDFVGFRRGWKVPIFFSGIPLLYVYKTENSRIQFRRPHLITTYELYFDVLDSLCATQRGYSSQITAKLY